MYIVVAALVLLTLVLLYQSRTREAFVTDASGNVASSNITLTLTDLISLFSLAKATSATPTTTTDTTTSSTTTPTTTTPTTESTMDATKFYNEIRPTLLSDLTNIVNTKVSGSPYSPPTPINSQAGSCNSDSMAQGCEYVDAKQSLEDNSDYIRKDSIPCYNCSL
jgi:hypothetical protein